MATYASRRHRWRWCVTLCCCATFATVTNHAVELGETRLDTDAALLAEIIDSRDLEPTSVFVRLASASAHAERALPRPSGDLSFSISPGNEGLVVRVEGVEPSRGDPFLLEIFSPSGREIVPMMLPGAARPSAPVTVVPPPDEAPTANVALVAPNPVTPAARGDSESRPVAMTNGTVTVQQGDTLWSIASRFQTDGMSTQQIANAIRELNPQAFALDSNLILRGAVITIPAIPGEEVTRDSQPINVPADATVERPSPPAPAAIAASRREIEQVIADRDARIARTATEVSDDRRDLVAELDRARFERGQAQTQIMELNDRLARAEADRDRFAAQVEELRAQLAARVEIEPAANRTPANPGGAPPAADESMTLRQAPPPAETARTTPSDPPMQREAGAQPAPGRPASGAPPPGGGMGWLVMLGVAIVVVVGVVATVLGIRRNRASRSAAVDDDAPLEPAVATDAAPSEPRAPTVEKAPAAPATPEPSPYEPPRDDASTRADDALSPAPQETGDEEDDLEDIGLVIADAGTKLALARAYIDIDDGDSAREILDEVVRDGTDKERAEAEKLLAKIDD